MARVLRRRNGLSQVAARYCITAACLTALAAIASVAATLCCGSLLFWSVSSVCSVAAGPPVQEMSDARQAICGRCRGGRHPRQLAGVRRGAGGDCPRGNTLAGAGVRAGPAGRLAGQAPRRRRARQRPAVPRRRLLFRTNAVMDEVVRRFLVFGKVQGVFFRHSARLEAKRLGHARHRAQFARRLRRSAGAGQPSAR